MKTLPEQANDINNLMKVAILLFLAIIALNVNEARASERCSQVTQSVEVKQYVLETNGMPFDRYHELAIDSLCTPEDKTMSEDLSANIKSGNVSLKDVKKLIKLLK